MRLSLAALVMLGGAGGAAMLLSATALSQSAANGPVRYSMDAATMSGFGAMAGGGGGGGLGAIMGMMRGGPPSAVRTLLLEHGAATTAPKPQADHFMPKGAGLGTSLRLLPPPGGESGTASRFERPSGRLLLFWGCGAKAPKGQPVVIDFAKLAAGQIPPGLLMNNVDLPDDWQLRASGARTYTAWPNGQGCQDRSRQRIADRRARVSVKGRGQPKTGTPP